MEKDTEDNVVGSVLLNAALALMSLYHFEEALKCIDILIDNRGLEYADIYYRRC